MTFHRLLLAAAASLLIGSAAPALAENATPAPAPSDAAPVTLGDLEIAGPFARATLPNAPVGAAYLTITNTGSTDDRLVSASTPVAGVTQLHEMKMVNDVMKMAELPDGIPIPAGQTVTLSFSATEDSSLQTSFVIDDVSLNVF